MKKLDKMETKSKNRKRRYGFERFFLMEILLLLSVTVFAADPPGIPDGWSDGFVYVNGVRIHYYQAVPAPEKPVVVMVHGVTDNGLCWTDVSLRLQNSYDIYMLDTRAHGLSDPFTITDDGETLMKDVVGFAEAMKFEKPILMGHSMGAATVMRVGAEYPNLAKAVIMLDPGLPRKNSGEQSAPVSRQGVPPRVQQRETEADPLAFRMFADPERLVDQNNYSYNDLVAKGRKENPKWSDNDVKYWALSKKQYHGPYSDAAWQAMHGTMRTEGALAAIAVKSLILKADSSPEGRQSNEEAVEGMVRVKLVHIEGAGHNLHHDELDQTIKEIDIFLNELL